MQLDWQQYLTFGAALLIVLLLIWVLVWMIRRIGGSSGPGRRGGRLGIVEATLVDRTRRLVLIRRDGVEHLVMIGGPQDLVVETNITKREPSLSAGDTLRGGAAEQQVRPVIQNVAAAPPEPRFAANAPQPVAPPPASAPPPPAPEPPAPVRQAEAPPPVRQAEAPPPEREPEPMPESEPGPVREVAEAPVEPVQPPAPPQPEPVERRAAQDEEPEPRPEMVPPRPVEDAPRPAAPVRPWPPSEGRFREAQRRFAERSDYNPPGRGGRHDMVPPEPHRLQERQVASRAGPDGMAPPQHPREASHEGPTREPANLNVRPGEDR